MIHGLYEWWVWTSPAQVVRNGSFPSIVLWLGIALQATGRWGQRRWLTNRD